MATEAAVTTAFKAKDKAILGSLRRMEKGVSKFGRSADMAFKKASRSGSRFGDVTKGILAAGLIQRAARGLWDMASGAVQLASDLIEVKNVVDVTFGSSAKIINDFARSSIKNFGLSELQAKDYAATLGSIIKPAGITGDKLANMSVKLAGLSGDFASFRNLKAEDVFNKIRSGITGETEPLKALGIIMTQANLKTFALTQGITKQWKAMSQAEQTMLRYNFIMKSSKDAQGDFNKTLNESLANQQRLFSVMKKQALAKIMTGIIPIFTKAMRIINEKLATINFDKVAKSVKAGADAFVGFAISIKNAFVTLLPAIKAAFSIFKSLLPVLRFLAPIMPVIVAGFIAYNAALKVQAGFEAVKDFLAMAKAIRMAAASQGILNVVMAANPIGAVILGITALIAVGVLLFRNWDLVKRKFFEWTSVFDNPIFAGIATILLPFVTIPILIARNWDKVAAVVSRAINIAKTAGGAVAGFFGLGGDEKPSQSQSRQIAEAPNAEQARARAQNVNISGTIGIAGAPPGSTAEMDKKSTSGVNMQLLGANP